MREMKLVKSLLQQPADVGQEDNSQLRPQRKSPPCHVRGGGARRSRACPRHVMARPDAKLKGQDRKVALSVVRG